MRPQRPVRRAHLGLMLPSRRGAQLSTTPDAPHRAVSRRHLGVAPPPCPPGTPHVQRPTSSDAAAIIAQAPLSPAKNLNGTHPSAPTGPHAPGDALQSSESAAQEAATHGPRRSSRRPNPRGLAVKTRSLHAPIRSPLPLRRLWSPLNAP